MSRVDMTRMLPTERHRGAGPTWSDPVAATRTPASGRPRRETKWPQLSCGPRRAASRTVQAHPAPLLEGLSYLETAGNFEDEDPAVAGTHPCGLASLRELIPERDFGSNDDD